MYVNMGSGAYFLTLVQFFRLYVNVIQVRMMDKLALEMETFEEILERFEVDVARAKDCGDYSQMVSFSRSGHLYST